jgi:hypothetical protein|tara:strand:+ start:861 stop:1103 length:243 start_codon:yes stop_codon:yes gene_type:complete
VVAFKTPKEWARAFLLVTATVIMGMLYFLPVFMELKPQTESFNYLLGCKEKWELIYMMLVTFYLKAEYDKHKAGKTKNSP